MKFSRLRQTARPISVAAALALTGHPLAAADAPGPGRSKGQVLVILSSQDRLTLKEGAKHPTGFFFPELMGPVQKLVAAGYEPVFADPKGNKAVMDAISDNASWFGDTPGAAPEVKAAAQKQYRSLRKLCADLGLCGDGIAGTQNLQSLSQIISNGLDPYAGVFVPGGHAPMEDLWKDKNLGKILRYFHQKQKPTALICHGPIALLSAMKYPSAFIHAFERNGDVRMAAAAAGWPYRGYSAAVFSTPEEQVEEPEGQANHLGGHVRFYPDQALFKAGARINNREPWHSNVVTDRELITGQNPQSEEALGDALVNALESKNAPNTGTSD